MDSERCEEIFRDWVESTVANWLNEICAWDEYLEDGITEEELEYIQDNLSLGSFKINNKQSTKEEEEE